MKIRPRLERLDIDILWKSQVSTIIFNRVTIKIKTIENNETITAA